MVYISNSIEPTNFVFGTNTQQCKLRLIIKMKVTLTDDEGPRQRSKVTNIELMVISSKVLQTQTSYLVSRYNTKREI